MAIVDGRFPFAPWSGRIGHRPERGLSGGTPLRSHQGARSVGRSSLGTCVLSTEARARSAPLTRPIPDPHPCGDPRLSTDRAIDVDYGADPVDSRATVSGQIVDKSLVAPRRGPYVSSRPEGSAKRARIRDPINDPGFGSATGDSIKGGPRGYRGPAPRPGRWLRGSGRKRRQVARDASFSAEARSSPRGLFLIRFLARPVPSDR